MDSGNSSSMQSSSGGADHQEYDSTTTPLHFHFNTTASPPPPPHHQQHMPPHLLPQPSPANLPADVDHLHPQTPTSALIYPYMMNTNPTNNVLLQQRPFSHNFTTTSSWTITTSPPAPTSIDPPGLLDPTYISFHPTPSSSSIEPTTTIPAAIRPPKNPRKRSRASRRAPTTVLTTDTSNFRTMVQEFTGIPSHAPPPSSSSPYSRLLSTSFNTRPPSPPFFPDPFFSFLHAQHQLAAPAGMLQGSYQQLPFANPPFQPTHHHIPQDIAVDPPPVVDCIHDRGVNQVITSSSSCGASTDFLAQQGDNTEQG